MGTAGTRDELPRMLVLTVPSILAGVLAAALVGGALTWRRRTLPNTTADL